MNNASITREKLFGSGYVVTHDFVVFFFKENVMLLLNLTFIPKTEMMPPKIKIF